MVGSWSHALVNMYGSVGVEIWCGCRTIRHVCLSRSVRGKPSAKKRDDSANPDRCDKFENRDGGESMASRSMRKPPSDRGKVKEHKIICFVANEAHAEKEW